MNTLTPHALAALQIKEPIFRIFRSESSRRLFAVHLTDNKENSLGVLKDSLTFDEAQECMLQYQKITQCGVIKVETEVETA